MLRLLSLCFYSFFALWGSLNGTEQNLSLQQTEKISRTEHSIKINGETISYEATAGTLPLKDPDGKVKASFFYVAYTKKQDQEGENRRPVTFCFNGGPGSASIWLHMGVFGPFRTLLKDETFELAPYSYVENEFSLLDLTDLVFIDPISTGYSKPAPGEDAKQFHSVDEDVQSVAEFVRLYTTRNNRWNSPKFLAGESYGTIRAAAMGEYLFDTYNLSLNGIVLISSALDLQTIDWTDGGNDLAYVLFLPSYTAAAWYHKKLPQDLLADLGKALKESEHFALGEYASALLLGDRLEPDKKSALLKNLQRYTGLPKTYLEKSNFRVSIPRFAKELLNGQSRIIGRFDSRFSGIDNYPCTSQFEFDPSADLVFTSFTAVFNEYLRTNLKWEQDEEYKTLADVFPWNYGKAGSNRFLNVTDSLKKVMTRNPKMKVFVANGYFDLATPYFSQMYTFNHLNLPAPIDKNIFFNNYAAGHMMYIHPPSIEKLKKDLTEYYQQALSSKSL